jgi:hypothetical protein
MGYEAVDWMKLADLLNTVAIRWDGSKSWYGGCDEEKNLCICRKSKPGRPALD